MSEEWRMVCELSNILSNNPLGGNLQYSTVEAMTVRQLGDAAAAAGVLPSELIERLWPLRAASTSEG